MEAVIAPHDEPPHAMSLPKYKSHLAVATLALLPLVLLFNVSLWIVFALITTERDGYIA